MVPYVPPFARHLNLASRFSFHPPWSSSLLPDPSALFHVEPLPRPRDQNDGLRDS